MVNRNRFTCAQHRIPDQHQSIRHALHQPLGELGRAVEVFFQLVRRVDHSNEPMARVVVGENIQHAVKTVAAHGFSVPIVDHGLFQRFELSRVLFKQHQPVALAQRTPSDARTARQLHDRFPAVPACDDIAVACQGGCKPALFVNRTNAFAPFPGFLRLFPGQIIEAASRVAFDVGEWPCFLGEQGENGEQESMLVHIGLISGMKPMLVRQQSLGCSHS